MTACGVSLSPHFSAFRCNDGELHFLVTRRFACVCGRWAEPPRLIRHVWLLCSAAGVMQGRQKGTAKAGGNASALCVIYRTRWSGWGRWLGLCYAINMGGLLCGSPPFLHLVIANVPLKIVCTSVQYQAYCPAPFRVNVRI